MRSTRLFLLLLCLLGLPLSGCNDTSPPATQDAGGRVTPEVSTPSVANTSASTAPPNTASTANQDTSTDAISTVSKAGALPQTLPPITIHLAGDSTVMTYVATTKQEGWGQELAQFFNAQVTIDNKAIGGANVKTFKNGNWKKIIPALKPGDYVLIQFGANDSGTAHGPVTPADFAATLGQMADEAGAKGATTIFVTPSAFYQWSGTKEDNTRLAPYAAAMLSEGAAKNVLVADLNARGVEYLDSIGQTAATPLYLPSRGTVDKAHFLKAGAIKMAELVAEEVRRIKSPLAGYLK